MYHHNGHKKKRLTIEKNETCCLASCFSQVINKWKPVIDFVLLVLKRGINPRQYRSGIGLPYCLRNSILEYVMHNAI